MGKGGSTKVKSSTQETEKVPAASAPVTPDNADVAKIRDEEKKRNKNQMGWQSTLLAGLGDSGKTKLGGSGK